MNLTDHGIMEIGYLHLEDKEKENYLKKFIKEFLDVFGEQGHSGGSAPFAINGFKRYTEGKTFVDKELKDVIEKPEECTDENNGPDVWMSHAVYELVSTYHKLVNTEEFVAYDIKEDWMLNILYKLMEWKPITPLQGTPDEWYTCVKHPRTREGDNVIIQNKRFSAIFAEDDHGKNAYNIDGKVFHQNGLWFTNRDSHVDVIFPYEVKDKEKVYLEDFIPVENSPKYYIKYKYDDGEIEIVEYCIGYIKSTLDTSINNPKFYKAEYCVLKKYMNEEKPIYYTDDEYRDMPIFKVRMESRFKEELKCKIEWKKDIIEGVYLDLECTKPVDIKSL